MLPPTPISPLFPYTTLFRSRIDKQHGSAPASGYGLPAPYRLENETQQAVNRAVGLLCRHRRIDQQARHVDDANATPYIEVQPTAQLAFDDDGIRHCVGPVVDLHRERVEDLRQSVIEHVPLDGRHLTRTARLRGVDVRTVQSADENDVG